MEDQSPEEGALESLEAAVHQALAGKYKTNHDCRLWNSSQIVIIGSILTESVVGGPAEDVAVTPGSKREIEKRFIDSNTQNKEQTAANNSNLQLELVLVVVVV